MAAGAAGGSEHPQAECAEDYGSNNVCCCWNFCCSHNDIEVIKDPVEMDKCCEAKNCSGNI